MHILNDLAGLHGHVQDPQALQPLYDLAEGVRGDPSRPAAIPLPAA